MDQGIHSEHQLQEKEPRGHPFWGRGGRGGRCGRGGSRDAWRQWRGQDRENEASSEEGKRFMSKEDRQKMREAVNLVREAAKTHAFELAGAAAGDSAGEAISIAVRSAIKRALILRKTTGGKLDDSSTSDSESDPGTETESGPSKKTHKKQVKSAIKSVSRLAQKEVSVRFGKLAGKWAAVAVRQTMGVAIKKHLKDAKKEAKRAARQDLPPQPSPQSDVDMSDASLVEVPPPSEFPNQQPQGASAPPQPMYPSVTGVVEAPADTPEVQLAIQTFRDMGYTPDDWLLAKIREAKGSIPLVFEKIRNN